MPITEMKPVDILVPLRRQEARGNYETARRMRSSIGQVFRYAVAIEADLAHADTNQVRRIYHRALYWEERVKMVHWWAQEVLTMAKGR